jgi:hypothetical protein
MAQEVEQGRRHAKLYNPPQIRPNPPAILTLPADHGCQKADGLPG